MDTAAAVKYAIVTFGCRVNQADSLAIEEELRRRGAVESGCAHADVVVVNTCSVTASADQGARQTIRRVGRENPRARIVVTGCYATREGGTLACLPGVVRVLPNSGKHLVANAVAESLDLSTAERFGNGDGACGAPLEPGVGGRTAFTLRVQTGCEERCSYCIIPSTRGPGRSLPIDRILQEVRRAASAGFREITLTGVHLGSYGRDLLPPVSLLTLLRDLEGMAEDVTFRISSLEPMDCTAQIVELVAASGGRFAPHFHLPLQHASDAMLAKMGRPYTLEQFRRLVDTIASRLPGVSIGTDLIVGFPGENEDDFAATAAYLPGSPLSHVHVFPYSDRPGTAATGMSNKVAGVVIRERGARLRTIGADLSKRFRAGQVGSIRRALVIDDGRVAVTDNYLKLPIAPALPRNTRVRIRVEPDLSGTVLDVS